MDGHDWDLQAVVRGCRLSGPPAGTRDPFSSFHSSHLKAEEPVDGKESDLHRRFPDPLPVRTTLPELEELCSPFFPKPKPHSQRQPLLTLHRTISSSPSAASCAVALPHRPRQPHRPLSQISRSKRRKNQQKRVVSHVPADGVSADMWAWRKYGQKPIKGSPYPRGYYKCSSSKGCPARKQVERSRTDPAMLVITYTDEHNHPLPSHRSSLAGITRDKLPSSSSPTQPPTAPSTSAPCGGGEGYQTARENPSYSPASTAAALSPTTSLTASMEDDLLLRQPSRPFKGGDEEEEEEEDEGGMLLVEDMEVMGEDDLVFMGMADVGGPTSVTAGSAFFDGDDGGFDGHFFPPPWLASNNNAAAAADGS